MQWLTSVSSEKTIAAAYATVSNHVGYLMHELDEDDCWIEEAFDAWQEYAADEAFVIPTLYRNQVMPVSNRVKDFSWAYDIDHNRWATVSVTAESR